MALDRQTVRQHGRRGVLKRAFGRCFGDNVVALVILGIDEEYTLESGV